MIAQLVEHLTVDQMVPGSIPGRRIFSHGIMMIAPPPNSAPSNFSDALVDMSPIV